MLLSQAAKRRRSDSKKQLSRRSADSFKQSEGLAVMTNRGFGAAVRALPAVRAV